MQILLSDTISCITDGAVKEALKKDRNTVFIVPEPMKAQLERCVISNIIEQAGDENNVFIKDKTKSIPVAAGFAGGDVLSFLRLSSRILESCGMGQTSSGSDIVLRNAIYAIIAKHHDEFSTFSTLTGRSENINKLISLLGDFVRYNVTAEELGKAIASFRGENNTYLDKLKDMKLLMEYLDELSSEYSLGLMNDPISSAADVLSGIDSSNLTMKKYRKLRNIIGHHFAVIQFGVVRDLTPGEYRLIGEIDRLSRGVDIYMNGSSAGISTPFTKNSDFVRSRLDSGNNSRQIDLGSDVCDDLISLVKDYANSDNPKEGTDSVVLTEIAGTDNRIGYVFDEIMKLTRNVNYRYRDIRIVCCDEELINMIRPVAQNFGLDVFVDRKISLDDTAVPRFVQLLLRLPISRFALGDVLAIMRTGMLHVHPRYCDAFENYCVARNITDASRMFNEENYKTDPDNRHPIRIWVEENTVPGVPEGIVNAGEFLYANIVENVLIPLRRVALEIYNQPDIAGKSEVILNYLDNIRLYIESLRDELMDSVRTDVAEATIRAYDETMALLASFMHEMNRVEITQRNFLELFRTDMMNKTSGTIPLKVDSVEITTPDHAFFTGCKVMFILGATRENFPFKRSSEGIMSSNELRLLANDISVELPDKAQSQSREEFITSCLMLGSVSDRIYMIHEQGKAKSRVFDFLAKAAGGRIAINSYETPVYGTPTPARFDFRSASISPRLMDILLKDGLGVSVTSIEKYMTCPIEFMLDSVLKIKERDDNREIRANAFGTLAHKLFEISVKETCEVYNDPEKLAQYADDLESDKAKLDKVCDEFVLKAVMEEKVAGSIDSDGNINPAFGNNQGNKLRRLFRFMFPKVLKECAASRFIPSGFELTIGKDPYLLRYSAGGHEFDFRGSVDRLDLGFDDENCFRIQDYKTFSKGFKPYLLLSGVQIQLPAYARAVMHGMPDKRVVDFGYSTISLDFDSHGKPLKFEPKNASISPEDMETAISYADYIISKAVEDIASGKATGKFNPADKSSSKYHSIMGLTGNPTSKPVLQDKIEADKDGYFDKMREIMGDKVDE